MHSANIPANYSPRVSSVEIARSLILLLDQITIFGDKNKFGTHMHMQGSCSLRQKLFLSTYTDVVIQSSRNGWTSHQNVIYPANKAYNTDTGHWLVFTVYKVQ